jgi:hypothetical protein
MVYSIFGAREFHVWRSDLEYSPYTSITASHGTQPTGKEVDGSFHDAAGGKFVLRRGPALSALLVCLMFAFSCFISTTRHTKQARSRTVWGPIIIVSMSYKQGYPVHAVRIPG